MCANFQMVQKKCVCVLCTYAHIIQTERMIKKCGKCYQSVNLSEEYVGWLDKTQHIQLNWNFKLKKNV